MKPLHLPSPAAGQHQPCRQIGGCQMIVSGSTAIAYRACKHVSPNPR
jgi:hypothetical protein